MHLRVQLLILCASVLLSPSLTLAQAYGQPDTGSPGDAMMQAYLKNETEKLDAKFKDDYQSLVAWQEKRAEYLEQYFYMLGLSPRPQKTPLHATVTGTVDGDGYVVEKLHYQSLPQLYVTGNLYRPATIKPGEKLPAVFFVCGHADRGRNGNKTAFQSHGIWLARHGYICLIVDTLQLGEIGAFHHGTYMLNRWWWHSRGYTPAGVEAWNGVRGIDYLTSRADVDPERIAVTGISGGGAATYWITAADERVKVAVPVSGMADLESYIPNRTINGHCDCMFFYNAFQWPWTRIAGIIAPRPLLFVNSDLDPIFPMDANERISNRLERIYSLFGSGDRVGSVVSIGGHAYRQDIREAAFRFLNSHLKGDARPITDSEVDAFSERAGAGAPPIPYDKLRVFPTDKDLPTVQRNTTIDEHFVPLAKPAAPELGQYAAWKKPLLEALRRVSFGYFPAEIPAAKLRKREGNRLWMESEDEVTFCMQLSDKGKLPEREEFMGNVMLIVLNSDEGEGLEPQWWSGIIRQLEIPFDRPTIVALCSPRGSASTRWTQQGPPNYAERSHALLGRTVDAGRVWDVIAAAKYLRNLRGKHRVTVVGGGQAGVLAAYAALLDRDIDAIAIHDPPLTHQSSQGPHFLNVLRVCDVPEVLGMLAPRPLTVWGATRRDFAKTIGIYSAAGSDGFTFQERIVVK